MMGERHYPPSVKPTVRKVAPVDTWPDIRVIVRPLPWTWRIKPSVYVDDVHPAAHCSWSWLFLTVEWWAQDRPRDWFMEPR